MKVWERFCDYYQKSRKDYEYYNSPKMYEQSGFLGPHFRMERDIVFHLARFCYNEFGDKWVHLESPIYKFYLDILDFHELAIELGQKKMRVNIDIEISDSRSFMIKNAKRGIFIEVKFIWQGCDKVPYGKVKDKISAIEKDLKKLRYLLKKRACEHAFMCIIDEEPSRSEIEKRNKRTWEKDYFPVKVLVYSYYGKVLPKG